MSVFDFPIEGFKSNIGKGFQIAIAGFSLCLLSFIVDIVGVAVEADSDGWELFSVFIMIAGTVVGGIGLIKSGRLLCRAGFKETGIVSAGGALIFWALSMVIIQFFADENYYDISKASLYIWTVLYLFGPLIFCFSLKQEKENEDKFFGLASNGMGMVMASEIIMIVALLIMTYAENELGVSVSSNKFTSDSFIYVERHNKYQVIGDWMIEHAKFVMILIEAIGVFGIIMCLTSFASYKNALKDLILDRDNNKNPDDSSTSSQQPVIAPTQQSDQPLKKERSEPQVQPETASMQPKVVKESNNKTDFLKKHLIWIILGAIGVVIFWAFLVFFLFYHFVFGVNNKEVSQFAHDFADYVNVDDREELYYYYPELEPTDSLISFLNAEDVSVNRAGLSGNFKITYSPETYLIVEKSGDNDFRIVESYGLLAFPKEKIEFASQKGVWKERGNDMAKRKAMSSPTFEDEYLRYICVLTDNRIRDVIRNNKRTASYNMIGRLYREAKEADLYSNYVDELSIGNPMSSFNIVSQNDDEAVVEVNYYDDQLRRYSNYTVTLKKQKISDNGTVEYVWDIDDILGHPDKSRNRAYRSFYINSVYSGIMSEGGPSAYWNSTMEYGDESEKIEYMDKANKFIQDLEKNFPDGKAR